MTLYRKTIFILSVTYACLIIVIYAVTYNLLIKGVDDLEKVAVDYEYSQLDNVLRLEENSLLGHTGDWAIWDDTYEFMKNGNQRFIDSNLMDISFISINIDLVLFVRNSGEILYNKFIDSSAQVGTTNLSKSLYADIKHYKDFIELKGNNIEKKGLISLDKNLVIFATRTIQKSDKSGNTEGTLFFGRIVNNRFIKDKLLSNKSSTIYLYPYYNNSNPEIIKKANYFFDKTSLDVYSLKRDDIISCFKRIKDVHGKPIFIIQIDIKRTVFQSVTNILNSFSIFLVVFSIIFAIITITLINMLVLQRFRKLDTLVNNVIESNDTSLRVSIEGKDELVSLIDSVNIMLDKIKESSESLKAIYEGVVDGVVIVDKITKTVVMVNSIILDLTGFEEDKLLGKPVDILFPNGVYTGSIEEYYKHFAFKTHFSKNIPSFKKDGDLIYFDVVSNSINYQGRSCLLTLFRDVTGRKKIEDELEKRRYDLELAVDSKTKELQNSLKNVELANLSLIEANKHKTNFLSTMSHELRTPLNAIMGFSELLSRNSFGQLTDKQQEFVKIIYSSSKHLLELINDILNLTRIDSGKMELDCEPIKQADFVSHIVNMMKSQLNKKNIEIELDLANKEILLNADLRKARQIMLNLLSNAIKYSSENGVIEIRSEVVDNSFVKVSVTDHGIGIEKENIAEIFTEFYQVNRLRDESLGGTGIGLALTKRLVEMHGGRIGLESDPGDYTTFWFTLPISDIFLDSYTK